MNIDWQQLIPTFVGSSLGFIFSIFLFYLTEKLKNNDGKKNLRDNLQKEIDYNINFLDQYSKDYDKLIREIGTDGIGGEIIFRAARLQRLFILEAFNKGILYKYLDKEDINELDIMLNFFSHTMDNLSWENLKKYREKSISKKESLQNFEYEKGKIDKAMNFQKKLKEKLEHLK